MKYIKGTPLGNERCVRFLQHRTRKHVQLLLYNLLPSANLDQTVDYRSGVLPKRPSIYTSISSFLQIHSSGIACPRSSSSSSSAQTPVGASALLISGIKLDNSEISVCVTTDEGNATCQKTGERGKKFEWPKNIYR